MSRHFATLLCTAVVVGCGESPTLPDSDPITRFVETSQLLNVQSPQLMTGLPNFGVRIFRARFGEETMCMPSTDGPHGPCYTSVAIGMEYRGRIGWLSGQPEAAMPGQFAFRANDAELFGVELAAAWRRVDRGTYASIYTQAMVRASVTPRATLVRIAHELEDYISTHTAHLLLQRPDVRTDVEILTILAELPVFQGDAYAHTRAVASGLLEELGALATAKSP